MVFCWGKINVSLNSTAKKYQRSNTFENHLFYRTLTYLLFIYISLKRCFLLTLIFPFNCIKHITKFSYTIEDLGSMKIMLNNVTGMAGRSGEDREGGKESKSNNFWGIQLPANQLQPGREVMQVSGISNNKFIEHKAEIYFLLSLSSLLTLFWPLSFSPFKAN